MKKWFIGIVTLAVGTASHLSAGLFDGSACCGSFEIGAEFIYLQPSACDLNYAIIDTRTNIVELESQLPQGPARAVNPDYAPGFRVMVGYVTDNGCSDVQLHYTWLHTSDHSRIVQASTPGTIWPTFMDPGGGTFTDFVVVGTDGFAEARNKYNYDAVDLQFGSRTMEGCDMWVRGYIGLHFANLDSRFLTNYVDIFDFNGGQARLNVLTRTSGNFWAIGPELGMEARYYISCGFGIGAKLQMALIAGERDGIFYQEQGLFDSQQQIVVTDIGNVQFGNGAHVIPVIHARLGVNYTWCCGDCFVFVGEVGYEFTSYINALTRPTFVGGDHVAASIDTSASGISGTNCSSFNLDGLYVMGRVTF